MMITLNARIAAVASLLMAVDGSALACGIRVHVLDGANVAVSGATLTLMGPGAPAVHKSDANGRALFDGLADGDYRVRVERVGFRTDTLPVLSLNKDRLAGKPELCNESIVVKLKTQAASASAPLILASDLAQAAAKLSGTVKWFSDQKGHGFITPDDGSSDIVVEIGEVRKGGMRLREGDRISYDKYDGPRGLSAVNLGKK